MSLRLPRPFPRRSLMPLTLALALNGLLVVPALRPPARTPSVAATVPRDDTPELLRFSRRQAREPAPGSLSLASLGTLPPPPPVDLAAPRPRGAPAAAGTPKRPRGSPVRPARATPPTAGGASAGTTTQLLAVALDPRAVEGAEATALEGLWEAAAMAQDPPAALPGLPKQVELRQLPLARLRGSGLSVPTPQLLLNGGRVVLLWPDGPTLWLLRPAAPRQRAPSRQETVDP